MTFVTAWLAIVGLVAASVPIIIHLLSRQRRKPIEWAAMRFLLEALRKHRRRLRAEQILLLAVRCLIVVLFGAALARPLLMQAGLLDRGGDRVVYLLIDNGLASGVSEDMERTALEANIQQAAEIIRGLQHGDRVGIATLARPSRLAISPPSTDHGSAINYLESLRPVDSPTDIPGALRALRPALEEHVAERTHTFVYLLSDLRAGSAPLETPLPATLRDLGDHVTLLAPAPAQSPAPNVQITSIDPVRHIIIPGAADGSGTITVRLARHGGELGRDLTTVRLRGEGLSRVEPRIVRWEPGQSQASVDFYVTFAGRAGDTAAQQRATGPREIAVTAEIDDDALNADNARHAVLELREQLRIVLLDRRTFGFEPTIEGYRSGQWIRRALEPYGGSAARDTSPMQVTEVEPAAVSASDLRIADVVIATRPDLLSQAGWSVLRDYVDRGGVLLVMPPGELNVHPWADRFTQSMDLPWRVRLETIEHARALPLAPEQPASEILHLISSELDDLARPVSAFRTLPIESDAMNAPRPLLTFADGTPMLVVATPGRGRFTTESTENTEGGIGSATGSSSTSSSPSAPSVVNPSRGLVFYLAAAPQLDWTDLPGKPLMVPLMHEVVRQGLSSVRAMQRVVTGERPALGGYGVGASARELVGPRARNAGEVIAIDETGRPQKALVRSGVYEMRDGAGQHLSSVAVNVDPASGRTDTLAEPAVMSWLAGAAPARPWMTFDRSDPAAVLRAGAGASPIAWILLWIVLGLIVLETLLQRWFSHALRAGEEREFGGLRRGLRATIRRTSDVIGNAGAATSGGRA